MPPSYGIGTPSIITRSNKSWQQDLGHLQTVDEPVFSMVRSISIPTLGRWLYSSPRPTSAHLARPTQA